ncbi:hypothetical protein KGF54_005483 [Candida jiufengensis]|uniref:uncharacterized protein n=1 Tax=Candida jiufengensis TaxID=497108 RepID=UPI0022257AAE|nr:uncharacterized protein KGF54_005483 [Candida jiufengensis]KAI5949605.1 hypothetical protein KGF54_005483 [Candida jiufengensis]
MCSTYCLNSSKPGSPGSYQTSSTVPLRSSGSSLSLTTDASTSSSCTSKIVKEDQKMYNILATIRLPMDKKKNLVNHNLHQLPIHGSELFGVQMLGKGFSGKARI